MNGHPQFEEDFELYGLGVLEGEEKRSFVVHLKSCPDCAQRLGIARGRIAFLGLSAPPIKAPLRTKARLLARIGGRAAPESTARLNPVWRWAGAVSALVSLVLAFSSVSLYRRNLQLKNRMNNLQMVQQQMTAALIHSRAIADLLTASDTVRVNLVAGSEHPVPQGKVFYHPARGLLFYAANLPELPAGKTYQLWLVPAQGSPISAGIFQTDPAGNGEVILPHLPAGVEAKAFAVTVEPEGGVPQPTGPKVLVGLAS